VPCSGIHGTADSEICAIKPQLANLAG